MPSDIYNLFELSASFTLQLEEAIRYFANKGLKISFSCQDMIAEKNDAAFTVAKMMNTDLLFMLTGR